jgi:hypothetical protein
MDIISNCITLSLKKHVFFFKRKKKIFKKKKQVTSQIKMNKDKKQNKKRKKRKLYRNNAFSSRKNKDIRTRNNSRTLSFNSFFDGINVPKIPQTKASVMFLLRQASSC